MSRAEDNKALIRPVPGICRRLSVARWRGPALTGFPASCAKPAGAPLRQVKEDPPAPQLASGARRHAGMCVITSPEASSPSTSSTQRVMRRSGNGLATAHWLAVPILHAVAIRALPARQGRRARWRRASHCSRPRPSRAMPSPLHCRAQRKVVMVAANWLDLRAWSRPAPMPQSRALPLR